MAKNNLCPQCAKDVGNDHIHCPHCGESLIHHKSNRWKWATLAVICLAAIAGTAYYFIFTPDKADMFDDYSYIVDSHITVLKDSIEVNAYFFKYFFQREDVQKKIYAECVNGSTNQVELSLNPLNSNPLLAYTRQWDKMCDTSCFADKILKSFHILSFSCY